MTIDQPGRHGCAPPPRRIKTRRIAPRTLIARRGLPEHVAPICVREPGMRRAASELGTVPSRGAVFGFGSFERAARGRATVGRDQGTAAD